MRTALTGATLMLAIGVSTSTQDADPEIVRHLQSIKAIDNHAHVMGLNHATDNGYDQLRCDALPVSPSSLPPQMLRFNPAQQAAMRTLYGFDVADDLEPTV